MKTFINSHKAVQQIFAVIAILALLFAAVPAVQIAQADHDPYGGILLDKVVVCHWDSSEAYKSSGDLAVAAINGHTNAAHKYDIIAPFHYDGGEFAGQNWNGWGPDGAPTPDFAALNPQDVWADCVGPLVLTGTIVVDKVTVPAADPESFTFTTSGGSYAGFSLTDADAPNSQVLNAGTYSVSETVPGGWTQTDVSCVSSLGGSENPASIGLTIGETVTCTFTNTKDTPPPPPEMPTVTVTKQTVPDGDPTEFQFYRDEIVESFATLSDGETSGAQTVATGTEIAIFEGLIGNWELTSVTCTDDDQQDVVASTTVDGVIIEALAEGDDVTCVFTNTDTTVPTFDISGSKFDWNTENGLEGWVIELYNEGAEVPFATTTTDVDGNYTFSGIANGPYTVCEVMQDGWEQMEPDTLNGCYAVEVDDEDVIDRDFWNREIPTYLIDGYKFEDVNGDGIWSGEGEDGLQGWVIELRDLEDALVATTTTDADGYYSFDVPAGDYVVNEVQQDGWQQTAPEVGTCGVSVGEQVFLLAIVDDVAEDTSCDFGNQRIPDALSCSFSANNTTVSSGTTVTLTWNTVEATDVSIDNGVGAVALDGSTDVVITGDVTYTLTASDAQTEESVQCQVSINEESGGGGGGNGRKIELRDDDPEPEVLGETDVQTEILPAGAPNAGMGGAAAAAQGTTSLVALFSLIASALFARKFTN